MPLTVPAALWHLTGCVPMRAEHNGDVRTRKLPNFRCLLYPREAEPSNAQASAESAIRLDLK